MLGLPRCFTFGGLPVDAAVARELLRALEPMAIEAAQEAERTSPGWLNISMPHGTRWA
jgi:hypothetical protein